MDKIQIIYLCVWFLQYLNFLSCKVFIHFLLSFIVDSSYMASKLIITHFPHHDLGVLEMFGECGVK